MNTPKADIRGKTALVTGASRGVGKLVAEALAKEGARVLVHGRTEAACAEALKLVRAAGAEAHVIAGELSDPAQVERIADRALALGGVDILYNNAAVMHPWREKIEHHTAADWATLPLVGYQCFPVESDDAACDAGGVGLLELRNCRAPCLSTLGIEVSP